MGRDMCKREPLRCDCCGLPFACIEGDELVIRSRHHGEKHENRIDLAELLGRLEEGRPLVEADGR